MNLAQVQPQIVRPEMPSTKPITGLGSGQTPQSAGHVAQVSPSALSHPFMVQIGPDGGGVAVFHGLVQLGDPLASTATPATHWVHVHWLPGLMYSVWLVKSS